MPPVSLEIDVSAADENCPAVVCEVASAQERAVDYQRNDGRTTTLTKTAVAPTFGLLLSSDEGKVFVKDLQPGASGHPAYSAFHTLLPIPLITLRSPTRAVDNPCLLPILFFLCCAFLTTSPCNEIA